MPQNKPTCISLRLLVPLHDIGTRRCFIAAHVCRSGSHDFLRAAARSCSSLAAFSTRDRAGTRVATVDAVLTMYFPDERCCDGSGADGGPRGPFDTAAPLVPFLSDALSGSQSCGGFLHPAAALLQRVLHPRAHDSLDLIQRAL